MKKFLIIPLLALQFASVFAQNLDCNKICVTDIALDSVTGEMLVTIFNGDTIHINYPIVQVVDSNGDTIGNPDGLFFAFAHPANDTSTHSIPTSVTFLPVNFSGVVILTDALWNITCVFNFPMNCNFTQPWPDCNYLTVENIIIDSIAGLMDVTIQNNCLNCASGINGPVYCEMKVISNIPPFDTLAETNCFCLLTPDNNNTQTYTLTSHVNVLPPVSDIIVLFHCGSGICDTLQVNSVLNINSVNSNSSFIIYPNPANDHINIVSDSVIGEIRIYNLKNQLILIETLKGTKETINLKKLSKGIYILQSGNYYYKIVKH